VSSGFRTRAFGTTLVGVALLTPGCSNDLATSVTIDSRAVGEAATAAATVCGLLRDMDNDLADIANDTALRVRNSSDPHQRVDEVLDGFDRLLARVELYDAAVATLDPTGRVVGDALVADLAGGAEDARAELIDERAAFALLPSVEDGDMTGRVGQFFNAIEKTMSVIEPVLADAVDAPTAAVFDAEPSCRFVVQHTT
jgi:hypothetical protein